MQHHANHANHANNLFFVNNEKWIRNGGRRGLSRIVIMGRASEGIFCSCSVLIEFDHFSAWAEETEEW